jgi:N-acetylglucosamine-1-phosphodiester alpha-N-acetylglucosaminidase
MKYRKLTDVPVVDSVQETGTQFASVKSARTALGHDSEGRLVVLQIEGETWSQGVDLYEFADLLVELGGG